MSKRSLIPIFLVAIIVVAAGGVSFHFKAFRNSETVEAADQHAGHPPTDRAIAYWYDAMNPEYKSDKPGNAPNGMKLVPMYQDQIEKMQDMPPGTVMLPPEKQQLIGVRTAPVEVADLSRTVLTVGRIETDETRVARIHTKFQGWIDKVYADFVGKLVRKGEPLFTVYGPELLATQQEYLIALKAKRALSSGIYLHDRRSKPGLGQSRYLRVRGRIRPSWAENLDDAFLQSGQSI
jgi:multidrug efflux pump subunit AcrA (membrane-fusion protein)